jgi:hypothetical protein
MKVAVLYSGICRGDWNTNRFSVAKQLPYDTFYSTWNDHVHTMPPGIDYKTYKQPSIDYHCMTDVPMDILTPKLKDNRFKATHDPQYREKTSHHTKQILAHAMMLKDLDPSYDMIIRCRYDLRVSLKVNLKQYVQRAYEENIAIGFGTRQSRHPDFNVLSEVPKIYPDNKDPSVSQDWGWYLMDPLIMHPRSLFDVDYCWKLHNDHRLLPAENGWYQILSEPWGDTHLSVYGGAQIEKYLR